MPRKQLIWSKQQRTAGIACCVPGGGKEDERGVLLAADQRTNKREDNIPHLDGQPQHQKGLSSLLQLLLKHTARTQLLRGGVRGAGENT